MNWRTIAELPRYEVSDTGLVRNAKTLHVLAQTRNNVGLPYRVVNFNRPGRSIRRTVHRLVAQAFVPNPNGLPVVRHLDGDCTNNRAENLAWGTMADNATDASKHGSTKGKRANWCSFENSPTGYDVMHRHFAGQSTRKIADALGLHQSSVARFIRRHSGTVATLREAA